MTTERCTKVTYLIVNTTKDKFLNFKILDIQLELNFGFLKKYIPIEEATTFSKVLFYFSQEIL